jgi:hypothetical protein
VYAVSASLGLALLTGWVVEPGLARRHLELYGIRSTPQQREQASRSLRLWQGLVELGNVVAILGLGAYMWEMTHSGAGPRFPRRAQSEGLTNRVW